MTNEEVKKQIISWLLNSNMRDEYFINQLHTLIQQHEKKKAGGN